MCAEPEQPWMPQSHEQGWMQKVAELTEQIKHLQQENERLNQALGLHAMEERKLRGLLSSCRTQINAAMRAESWGLCKRALKHAVEDELEGSRYIWSVRETGDTLDPEDIHPGYVMEGEA